VVGAAGGRAVDERRTDVGRTWGQRLAQRLDEADGLDDEAVQLREDG